MAIVTCATLTLCSARVQAQAPAFTIDGNVALWTMEQLMAKLREVLAKSTNPTRRQQLTGWKVMRIKNPLPDGNVAYVHVINPVIPGADYTIMQTLYDEFPGERHALYEVYPSAFVANLSLATGEIALDMTQSSHAPSSPAR